MKTLEALDVASQSVSDSYKENILNQSEVFSTPALSDLNGKFDKLYIDFMNITNVQTIQLNLIKEGFILIQTIIDPTKLCFFESSKGSDDELILRRESENGVSKLIIHDDGAIAYWFIAFKESQKANIRNFYHLNEKIDFEVITYNFFTY